VDIISTLVEVVTSLVEIIANLMEVIIPLVEVIADLVVEIIVHLVEIITTVYNFLTRFVKRFEAKMKLFWGNEFTLPGVTTLAVAMHLYVHRDWTVNWRLRLEALVRINRDDWAACGTSAKSFMEGLFSDNWLRNFALYVHQLGGVQIISTPGERL